MRRHKRSGMPNREAIEAHWFPDKFAQFGVARHEHAAERLARAGFTEARLGQMLDTMGGDATIDTVFKAIGIEGTAADVRAMFNNGDLV